MTNFNYLVKGKKSNEKHEKEKTDKKGSGVDNKALPNHHKHV